MQEYSTRPAYDEERVCRDTVTFLDKLVAKIKCNTSASLICFLGRAVLPGSCSSIRHGAGPLALPRNVPTYPSFASTPPCRFSRLSKLCQHELKITHQYLNVKKSTRVQICVPIFWSQSPKSPNESNNFSKNMVIYARLINMRPLPLD